MTIDKANTERALKILSLEDSAKDFELVKELLEDAGYTFTIERVETEEAFTSLLHQQTWDIILADFKLPYFDAFRALRIRNEICPDTPYICVSGSIGEETAVEMLKSGAVDYVIKDRPDRLPFSIDQALTKAQEKKIAQQQEENLKDSYHQLQESQEKLQKTIDGVIRLVVNTVESRDAYTAGHQQRVALLASAIAEEMGLSANVVKGVEFAGKIHDLGKISVPAEILSKPTKLYDAELELIQMHSQKGYDILKEIEFPWPIAEAVYQHHERMDGSGYPRGLKGEDILLEARIICVADVVEAMASHRPYRPSLGIEVALGEIKSKRGTLFDAVVVDACLRLFLEKGYLLEDGR